MFQFKEFDKAITKPYTIMVILVIYLLAKMFYNFQSGGEFVISLLEMQSTIIVIVTTFIWRLWNKSEWREYKNKKLKNSTWKKVRKVKKEFD